MRRFTMLSFGLLSFAAAGTAGAATLTAPFDAVAALSHDGPALTLQLGTERPAAPGLAIPTDLALPGMSGPALRRAATPPLALAATGPMISSPGAQLRMLDALARAAGRMGPGLGAALARIGTGDAAGDDTGIGSGFISFNYEGVSAGQPGIPLRRTGFAASGGSAAPFSAFGALAAADALGNLLRDDSATETPSALTDSPLTGPVSDSPGDTPATDPADPSDPGTELVAADPTGQRTTTATAVLTPMPLPATALLLIAGLGGLTLLGRRQT